MFLAASRASDIDALRALLHPDALLSADDAVVELGQWPVVRGAGAIAETFSVPPKSAQLALIDDEPGYVTMRKGEPHVALVFTIRDGTIFAIDLIGDPERLSDLKIQLLD